ncbi:endonuclease/exonuclease/phosphatase family protein [Urechidicola croceus]|uniref:Endonuclease n=1 Tax=Urechidicola croceus TaxID=1850246 RepID=A0A1D8P8S8_9FLAO|nr:endonuclease [Urechidicola croceus]AOW20990.1 endonuclease [Urechidicola croceus]
MKQLLLSSALFFALSFCVSQENTAKNYSVNTIAFYNLENLLDTIDNPDTKDEYSPILQLKSGMREAYLNKVQNMAKVISEIGKDVTGKSPVIIGLCEIENETVLKDLLATDFLKNENYNFVHVESPDWRGIDVAFLYKESVFNVTDFKSYELKAWNKEGFRVRTRDQLLVSGYLDGEAIHFIVNHWPSQRGGQKKSEYLRIKAAELNLKIIEELRLEDSNAKIISMGDFNDDPNSKSFKKILQTTEKKSKLKEEKFYNPFEDMFKRGFGTLGFRDNINLFDQLLISSNLVSNNYDSYKFYKAGIFNPRYLTNKSGKYKGYPFRSFSNNQFTGGYSDHYPTYIYLIKEIP